MEQFEITLKDGTIRKGNAWSIKDAKANLSEKNVEITCDESLDINEVIEAIKKAGYDAK